MFCFRTCLMLKLSRYCSSMRSALKQIDTEVHNLKSDDPGRDNLQTIVASLQSLLFIEDLDGDEEPHDEREEAGHHLRRLQEEYRSIEMKLIQQKLEKLQYHLDDKAAVAAAIGDQRIELVRLPPEVQFTVLDSQLTVSA